jgi:hypothetical protein
VDTTEKGNRGERGNNFLDNFCWKELFVIQIWCWGVWKLSCLWQAMEWIIFFHSFTPHYYGSLLQMVEIYNCFKFITWIHVFLKFWIIWFCQCGSRHHRLPNWKIDLDIHVFLLHVHIHVSRLVKCGFSTKHLSWSGRCTNYNQSWIK